MQSYCNFSEGKTLKSDTAQEKQTFGFYGSETKCGKNWDLSKAAILNDWDLIDNDNKILLAKK